jgi:hypothetical protein
MWYWQLAENRFGNCESEGELPGWSLISACRGCAAKFGGDGEMQRTRACRPFADYVMEMKESRGSNITQISMSGGSAHDGSQIHKV